MIDKLSFPCVLQRLSQRASVQKILLQPLTTDLWRFALRRNKGRLVWGVVLGAVVTGLGYALYKYKKA